LTREVRDCIKAKEKAYNVVKSSGKSEDWEDYKNKQRATKKEIRREKIKYEGRQLVTLETIARVSLDT